MEVVLLGCWLSPELEPLRREIGSAKGWQIALVFVVIQVKSADAYALTFNEQRDAVCGAIDFEDFEVGLFESMGVHGTP